MVLLIMLLLEVASVKKIYADDFNPERFLEILRQVIVQSNFG